MEYIFIYFAYAGKKDIIVIQLEHSKSVGKR